MHLSNQDKKQLALLGVDQKKFTWQLEVLNKKAPVVNLNRPADIGDGILELSKKEQKEYAKFFDKQQRHLSCQHFIPASGAATRMFKTVYELHQKFSPEKHNLKEFLKTSENDQWSIFLKNIGKFPFYPRIAKYLKKKYPLFRMINKEQQYARFLEALLSPREFNFGGLPKGLLPFHLYKSSETTAFEEQLRIAARVNKKSFLIHLHFTVQKEHLDRFKEKLDHFRNKFKTESSKRFSVTFSFQNESTATPALTEDGKLLRDEKRNIIFRPSGHGALLDNLNDSNADIVFIQNIDNVVTKRLQSEFAFYKKVMGGKLLEIREKVFSFAKALEKKALNGEEINRIRIFVEKELNIILSVEFDDFSPKRQGSFLLKLLNRPIRVCGMIPNVQQSGGGPFWIKDSSGSISLQIVEAAQINEYDSDQKKISEKAAFFHPANMVCSLRNHHAKKFDLRKFANPNLYFTTKKSYRGQNIKALEMPGLWNGSMAFWNTLFLALPNIAFNPVKTVNDLLKPSHQEMGLLKTETKSKNKPEPVV